jgi:hypothetical protein
MQGASGELQGLDIDLLAELSRRAAPRCATSQWRRASNGRRPC